MATNKTSDAELKKLALEGFEPKTFRYNQRHIMKACGYCDDDVDRPVIGIVNTHNDLLPGHTNFNSMVEWLKQGVARAGGIAAEFGTISICDGMSAPHWGENYVLPSRDIIADSVEAVACGQAVDGLILMCACDKIVPGMLMAAARLDIPCIIHIGGPMTNGGIFNGRRGDCTSYPEAVGMLQEGFITEDDVTAMSEYICPTCGSCQFIGTANSMSCLAESIGMALTGSSTIPAVYNDRKRAAFAAGMKIVELVNKGITARQIITRESIQNAIAVCQATGSSTNCVIHTLAIAHEIGLDPNEVLAYFNEYKDKTPLVAHINPNADVQMEEFNMAGGIPRVEQAISRVLNLDVMTCTGHTLRENLDTYKYKYPENRDAIRGFDDAFEPTGGLVVLRGNMAPDSCVAKPSGILPKNRIFTGPAVVFDSQEELYEGMKDGRVHRGVVIVIRYEGPKGGPGAREMGFPLKMIKGMGILDDVAMITDGRYSGTNNGCFVGHVSPEAAAGGPIAIVRDGDLITIDTIEKREVTIRISDEEIAARLKEWHYEPKPLKGMLARYAAQVTSFNTGAVLMP